MQTSENPSAITQFANVEPSLFSGSGVFTGSKPKCGFIFAYDFKSSRRLLKKTFNYFFQLVRARRLVNFAGRMLLYGPQNLKVPASVYGESFVR